MNADEIIKAAPELLKHGAELVGALKLTEIAKAMLGPATSEFAERVKDEIRLYRFGRQLELLKKAEKMVQDAGFTPKAVPIKLLFPLLEGASLEENEDLHTMWAALLANAASSENAGKVRPALSAILRELAPDEAALLNWMYIQRVEVEHGAFQTAAIFRLLDAQNEAHPAYDAPFSHDEIIDAFCALGFGKGHKTVDGMAFETCLWSLDSKKLIQLKLTGDTDYLTASLTFHGAAFAQACRPPAPTPKPKS